MEKKPLTEFNRHVNILFPTGLMAIVLILLQALISTSHLNIPQSISMLIFSISIPLLALEIVARRYQQMIGYSPVSKLHTWTGYVVRINYFLVIAGVGACLWGARWLFAILFV